MYAKINGDLEKELKKIELSNNDANIKVEKSIIVINASVNELRKL